MLPVTMSYLVLGVDCIIHESNLSIDCELIDLDLAFGIENLHLRHVIHDFSQEVATKRFFFVVDILHNDLARLTKRYLKKSDSFEIKKRHKVIFYERYD